MPVASDRSLYRLRGTVAEQEKTFDLPEGSYSLGCSRKADIVLPVDGVSRQHAVLIASKGALVVEDRGSRNGTSIDGVRVQRSQVPMGAELRLGPVCLRVETVAPEEAELAIALERTTGSTASARFEPERSTVLVREASPQQAAAWLSCVEELARRLSPRRPGAVDDALAYLAATLGLSGCCALEWPETGEPLVMGAWGALHDIPSRGQALRLARSAARGSHDADQDASPGAAFFPGEPPLSIAVARARGRDPVGLLLWGDFSGRPSSGALLGALLAVLGHARDAQREPSAGAMDPERAGAAPPGLVLPAGYRPGTSPPMVALYTQMRRLARGSLPVLITGETGAGKELVARILHDSSERRAGPFVAINCAAIPAELLEAEMFGIGKGVATGVEPRPGKFQLAEAGTLLLDEIGEMAPALQAKLLRVLQEKEIHPLGDRPRPIDVRVVAATNVDLAERIESGALRADLYYRLAGCVLEVPPLRHRPEDIPALVEHFLRQAVEDTGVRVRGVTVAALRALAAHPWPGNIRELENAVQNLVSMSADGDTIGAERVLRLLRRAGQSADPIALLAAREGLKLAPLVEEIEKALIIEALRRTGGNQSEAARLLGLARGGLTNKMKRHGIEARPGRPRGDDEPVDDPGE